MGVQVVPALVVFQTPPDATATYQVAGRVGSTAMSEIRPEVSAGPMGRSSRPLQTSPDWLGLFSAFLSFLPAALSAPAAGRASRARVSRVGSSILVIDR